MVMRRIRQMFVILLAVLISVSALSAYAANVAVPVTRLTDQSIVLTADTLKPAACSALTLTRIVICVGGNCDGTASNELILGTTNGERIRGRGGTDCILGGGGDDQLVGNGASDVCIGGPGNDTFTTCETTIQ